MSNENFRLGGRGPSGFVFDITCGLQRDYGVPLSGFYYGHTQKHLDMGMDLKGDSSCLPSEDSLLHISAEIRNLIPQTPKTTP